MARPPGALRVAVLEALRSGPGTLLDIAERSKVGYSAVRYTVPDALRSGVVQICGHEKRPHAKRWLAVYELAQVEEVVCAHACTGHVELGSAMSCWGR